MKKITLQEIRERLARDDAESIYEYRDTFDVYLNGCPGYMNMSPDSCVDYYLAKEYLYDSELEDNEVPVDVAYITDDTGEVLYVVSQYCAELSWRSGIGIDKTL